MQPVVASPKLTSRFAVPFVETYFPNWKTINPVLRETFIAWEHDKSRKRKNLPTGVMKLQVYESDFDLFQHPEPEVQLLANFCLNSVGRTIAELNGYNAEEMSKLRIFQHSWYHITRNGGYTGNHNHPMASWSGVYCVDSGDRDPEMPANGLLKFIDSRAMGNMYMDPGNARLTDPYGFGDIAFALNPGQLVLFPSYIFHEVTPYLGKRERVTVAFNAWARYADQASDEPSIRV